MSGRLVACRIDGIAYVVNTMDICFWELFTSMIRPIISHQIEFIFVVNRLNFSQKISPNERNCFIIVCYAFQIGPDGDAIESLKIWIRFGHLKFRIVYWADGIFW